MNYSSKATNWFMECNYISSINFLFFPMPYQTSIYFFMKLKNPTHACLFWLCCFCFLCSSLRQLGALQTLQLENKKKQKLCCLHYHCLLLTWEVQVDWCIFLLLILRKNFTSASSNFILLQCFTVLAHI